jgi:hypothetical protein
MILRAVLFVSVATFLPVSGTAQSGSRTWTDVQGRKVVADFGGVEGENVILKMAGGKTLPYAITKLSAEDQAFIKAQSAAPPAANTGAATTGRIADFQKADAARVPMEKRVLPEMVEVNPRSLDMKTVKEDATERNYVYQSEAFEFSSQAKLADSVIKKVAVAFELTRELLRQLPWGLVCTPPEGFERYQAKLFETREDYMAAGGPELSGGVYNGGTKVFMVPFQSIGLEKRGQTYFRNDSFSNGTLVHEITHQLMDDYLAFLPKWVIEGTAEYTEILPDTSSNNGFLVKSHQKGIKEYIENMGRGVNDPGVIPSLEQHMNMTREQWDTLASNATGMRSLYYRSAILVYYFNHMDGEPKGARFMKFMDAVHGEVRAMHEFFANPQVKRSPGGGFTYPRSLTPPDFRNAALKHVGILVNERPYEDIAKLIVSEYKKIGVKLTVN